MTDKTRAIAGTSTAGEALLESMQAVQHALMQPSGLSPEQLSARIQEWQQAVTELSRQQMHSGELATLYEIAGVMNASLDLAETLGLVMDALIHLTGAERGCLMLFNEEGGLEVRAAQNFDQQTVDAFDLELSRTVVREAAEKGSPVLTTNAQLDPRFADQESVIGYHLRSIVCVPLRIREGVIGALYLDNRMRDGVFSRADLHILTAFANQAAVAIENARLYTTTDQALTARVEELTTLYRASRSIGEATDFQEIVRGAAEIAPLLGMTGCSLTVVTATDGQDTPTRSDVYSVFAPEDDLTPIPPVFDFSIADQQAALRAYGDPDFVAVHADVEDPDCPIPQQVREAMLNVGARSAVTAGLSIQRRPVGFLTFCSMEPLIDFLQDHGRHVRAVADQVAPVLDNLRLLEETRRRAREMELINEVGRAVTSVLDLNTLIGQITDLVKARFGLYFVGIALVEGDWLVYQGGSTVGDSDARFERGHFAIPLAREPSLAAQAAHTGLPVLSNDTLNDPRYLAVEELPDTRSELCLPIRVKGRVIGVLDVQADRPFAYSQTDAGLFQALADQAGVAIENARLFEEARTHTEDLSVLNELGQALTARLDVDEVLHEAYQGASRLLDAANFLIGLYDPENDEIAFLLDTTESEIERQFTVIPASQGITGYIVRNRTSVLIRENMPEQLTEMGVELIGELPLSFLGVPLIVGDRVLGAMTVQSFTTPRAYDEHDRDLLTAIASQTAIALQNAQLYEQAQHEIAERRQMEEVLTRRNRDLTTLYQATTAISSALSLDIVLLTVAEQMAHAVGSDGCTLSIWKRQQGTVETLVDYSAVHPDQVDRPGTSYDLNDYPTTRRVLETRQPAVIQHDDPAANPAELALMEKQGTYTLLMLPLLARDQVLGLVELTDEVEAQDYTPEQIRLAQSLATQAAIAIENARLYEQAQQEIVDRKRAEEKARRRATQAALVYEVGQRVSGELELETLLSEIVTAVHDAFDYYSVLLMLLDEEAERLVLQSVAGTYTDTFSQDTWIAVGEGMTGHTAATGTTQISGNVTQNPHYVRKTEERTQSELAVPIKSRHKVIGVLDLQSDELDAFDETDVMLMEILADQLAVAIENARLYEETQQRLQRQTLLFEASQRLASASLRAEEIAEIGVRQLVEVLDSTECSFSLLEPDGDTMRILADFWIEDGVGHWGKTEGSFRLSDYPATACVMESLEPLVVQASDPDADPAELAYMQKNDEAATLAIIPLAVKGQAQGVMELETWEERHYTPEQLSIAMMLANQVAVALENARLYEAMQQELAERRRAEEALATYARQQAALFQLSANLASALDETEVCQIVVRGLHDALGYDYLGLFLVDEATGERVLRAAIGWPDAPPDWRIPPGQGLSERAILDGQLHYTPDVTQDPHYVPGIDSGSEVDAPIRISGQVIGVLVIEGQQPYAFDEADFAVLTAAANQAAIALQRAWQHQALKEAEVRYRSLFDRVPVGLYRSTPQGQLLQVNPTFREMLSYPDAETLAAINAVDLYVDAADRQQWQAMLEQQGIVRDFETRMHRGDGSIIWALDSARVVRNAEGQVLYYEGSLRDITTRRRTEEALERRATQLALLNDIGGKLAAVLDLESVLDTTVHLVQQSFGYHHVSLFTVDREQDELVMRTRAGDFTSLFPPDHRLKLGQGMVGSVGLHGETLLANDVEAESSYVNLYPDLIPTRSELSVPVQIGEEIVGVLDIQSPQRDAFDENDVLVIETMADQVAVAIENARLYDAVQQELAERRRAEEQLHRYASELEQANEEVKRFAYIVSHDLRAPLVNLKGFAAELRLALDDIESVVSRIQPYLDEDQTQILADALRKDAPEALEFMDSSVAQMDHFIGALLTLSRLGHRELKLERINMDAIVQAALQTLAHQIAEHQAKVTVEALPEVVADQTSMEQIVGNILGNAVKYLAPERPGEIEITAERSDKETIFHVRDNGRGIAEHDMDKVFAPFRRAGTQDIPGDGMGLAYVQALVRRHGGRIWCESELGVGTLMTFTVSNYLSTGWSNERYA